MTSTGPSIGPRRECPPLGRLGLFSAVVRLAKGDKNPHPSGTSRLEQLCNLAAWREVCRVVGVRSVSVPEFFDVVDSQRACREFRPDPVPDQLIERVLGAAVRAPSAENLQPWVFLVLRDAAQRAAIGDVTRRLWEDSAREFARPRLSRGLFEDADRGAVGGVAAAPVLIVVCGDTSVCHERALSASIYPAVQNLLLAAGALGLGSVLTTLPTHGPLGSILGLPDTIRPLAVVPLGWPVRPLARSRRRPMADRTHRERYGAGWDAPRPGGAQ